MKAKTKITIGLAVSVSSVCVAMAAAVAADRAVTTADQIMLTASAGALALGSHFIPALAPRKVGYVLFLGCIASTIYSHAHYFEHQSYRAGQVRVETIKQSSTAQALQSELTANTARPLEKVSAELAQATSKAAYAQANLVRCQSKCTGLQAIDQAAKARVVALTDERSAALRAQDIRQQLVSLAEAADTTRAATAQNPVDAQLSQITGIPVPTVGLLMSVLQSLMLEVMAALLWATALPKAQSEVGQNPNRTTLTTTRTHRISLSRLLGKDQTESLSAKPKAKGQANKPRDSPVPTPKAIF